MTTPEVDRAAAALLEAIKNTEVFQTYARLKESVMSDEGNKALLRRFTSAQTALQMAALVGVEAKEEDAAAFEQLSTLLYANTEISDYLLAQLRVQQLAGTVMERLTREMDIDIQLPE